MAIMYTRNVHNRGDYVHTECPRCGLTLEPAFIFCPTCGQKIVRPIKKEETTDAEIKIRKVKRKDRKNIEKKIDQLGFPRVIMNSASIPSIQSETMESVVFVSADKYMKMQSDIRDLTATIEALEGVIEEQRARNKTMQGRLEEVTEKYRALMESYHQVQGW